MFLPDPNIQIHCYFHVKYDNENEQAISKPSIEIMFTSYDKLNLSLLVQPADGKQFRPRSGRPLLGLISCIRIKSISHSCLKDKN